MENRYAIQFRRRRASVEASFDSDPLKVFATRTLERLIAEERANWRLSSVPIRALLDLLQTESHFSILDLQSEKYRAETRLVWRTPSPFEIALSMRPGGYLSHATAAYLHGLTDDVPSTFYVNKEQSLKGGGGTLIQANLDRAFANRQRQSNLSYKDPAGNTYVVLAGRFTNRLEVGNIQGPEGELLVATKLERTLIDLVVRPLYAGGVQKVVQAFSKAKGRVSTNVLVATVKKLAYVYPYHQAIGFYLERAGFEASTLDRIREMGLQFDFYLAHGLKDAAFDPTWRVHHPRSL